MFLNPLSLLLVSLTTGWNILGTAAVLAATKPRTRRLVGALPPVTVLKPLCGADPDLRANLETFFLQDHPEYELLFGVERPDDPAISVVTDLLAAYPHVRARVIAHVPPRGENPKVRNLRGILPHASFDLVLLSDSNVRAPRSYVSDAARTIALDPSIGLVTNVFVGTGGGTLGGDLECVQLTGFCAGGAALPTMLGDAAVVGKSMLLSRSVFESLGGFARVADVLAEDFVIGKMFQHAGYRVVIARTVLENIVGGLPFGAFFDRQLRWSMLRLRLRPAAFVLEPLTSPLAMLPFAWAVFGAFSLAWMVALLLVRDVVPWLALHGTRDVTKPLSLSVARDLAALAVWLATPFRRHVSWRGCRLRVGRGTAVYADE